MELMTNQTFQEWLDQCPAQWFLLDSDYRQKTYQFIVEPECTCDPTCGSGCEGCCEEEDDS